LFVTSPGFVTHGHIKKTLSKIAMDTSKVKPIITNIGEGSLIFSHLLLIKKQPGIESMKIWQDSKLSFLPLPPHPHVPPRELLKIHHLPQLRTKSYKNHLQNISLIKGFPSIPLKTFILAFY
jgi:hypothetical protein